MTFSKPTDIGPETALERQERAIALRAERRILAGIADLVTDEVIAEHLAEPFGDHSWQLDRVLNYLRRGANPRQPRLLIVADPPERQFRLAELEDGPSRRVVLLPERFPDIREANHQIFLRRLAALDLLPEEGTA